MCQQIQKTFLGRRPLFYCARLLIFIFYDSLLQAKSALSGSGIQLKYLQKTQVGCMTRNFKDCLPNFVQHASRTFVIPSVCLFSLFISQFTNLLYSVIFYYCKFTVEKHIAKLLKAVSQLPFVTRRGYGY